MVVSSEGYEVEMDSDRQTLDPQYLEYVRQKAHAAIVLELRDYDWSLLSPETARKIHTMLPPDQ
jgi:hypothetical protein